MECFQTESAYCSGDECYSSPSYSPSCDQLEPESVGPLDTRVVKEIDVEVAIIGNGPSSIFLSLLLSGYRPYFTGNHPNPILAAKLNENITKSLLEQDLEYLSEGLEGRSKNPVSLLVDTLMHPNADIGETHPSSLIWHHDKMAMPITHVVLGRGKPGGIWHYMQPTVRTLSLGRWLQLPLYSMAEYKRDQRQLTTQLIIDKSDGEMERETTGTVANYYHAYVDKMGLRENFIDGVFAYKLHRIADASETELPPSPGESAAAPVVSEDTGIECLSPTRRPSRWEVHALPMRTVCQLFRRGSTNFDEVEGERVVVRARKVALACGLCQPKRLCVPGEQRPYVKHIMSDFTDEIESVKNSGRPIVVIGAGISAADAILYSLSHKIPLYHVFYQSINDRTIIFSKLPKKRYSEYHHLWQLMLGAESSPYYTPISEHKVAEFKEDKVCELVNVKDNSTMSVEISAAVVMVGSRPRLCFVPEELRGKLPIDSAQPMDSKHNPVDVDLFSSQCENVPDLYALGSLVGDNFVRFVYGSSLACAQHVLR